MREDTWSYIQKNLSEIAHDRLQHNAASFRTKWIVRLGMCLAKEGAKASVARMRALVAHFKGRNAAYEQRDIDILPAVGVNEVLVDSPIVYAY